MNREYQLKRGTGKVLFGKLHVLAKLMKQIEARFGVKRLAVDTLDLGDGDLAVLSRVDGVALSNSEKLAIETES